MRLVLQQTEEINYGASHKGRPVKNRKYAECRNISTATEMSRISEKIIVQTVLQIGVSDLFL